MGIKKPEPIEIAVMMSDDEFQEYHAKLRKQKLMSDLMQASSNSFSVKNISRKRQSASSPKSKAVPLDEMEPAPKRKGLMDSIKDDTVIIGDSEWDEITSKGYESDYSAIGDITKSTLGKFSLDDLDDGGPAGTEKDPYKNLFKNEQTMLAEILKDVTEQAKAANAKLKDMTKKSAGYGGVSKTYPDLLSAANSLNSTRLSIVGKMADLKTKAEDFRIKKMKEDGPKEESKDDIASKFFDQIIANRRDFVSNSGGFRSDIPNATYEQSESAGLSYSGNNDGGFYADDGGNRPPSYSITSSIQSQYDEPEMGGNNPDPYGYIANEGKGISICVQRYQDGRVEFVAIDETGELVDGYELPGDDLLESLRFRIGSNYASDEEGRRYRIIDVNQTVDIDDVLDDNSYPDYEDNRL